MENISYNHVGTWNFKDSTTLEEIKKIASELAKDDHYLSIRVRRTSENSHGIDFEYTNSEHKNQEDFQNYLKDTSKIINEISGDKLSGWDISSSYYKIK